MGFVVVRAWEQLLAAFRPAYPPGLMFAPVYLLQMLLDQFANKNTHIGVLIYAKVLQLFVGVVA